MIAQQFPSTALYVISFTNTYLGVISGGLRWILLVQKSPFSLVQESDFKLISIYTSLLCGAYQATQFQIHAVS